MKPFDSTVWNNHFIQASPLFLPLANAYHYFHRFQNWPTLDEYNQALHTSSDSTHNSLGNPINFVDQNTSNSLPPELQYEPRIYLSGEVQTRLANWHDFFQVLVWRTWPKTKSLLNKLHYTSSIKRTNKQRSPTENFLTLFDECGIVILSSNPVLLELIRNFQWQTLFCINREKFEQEITCITFGHAMYEKALNPYIGMTAQALLIEVEPKYFENENKADLLDEILLENILAKNSLEPKKLNPFPLLGVPGWYKDQSDDFYRNTQYFRTGRTRTR